MASLSDHGIKEAGYDLTKTALPGETPAPGEQETHDYQPCLLAFLVLRTPSNINHCLLSAS